MKDTILRASVETAANHGLNEWTVEEVANRAKCAKGLVNYHYRSKGELLSRTTETVAMDRLARRLSALSRAQGATALDALWEALSQEVDSGWFAAWLGFLSAGGKLRLAATLSPDRERHLVLALHKALDLPALVDLDPALVAAILDGLALRLLQGEPVDAVREAYHRFWVTVL